jgi:hypothetical protein
VYRLLLLCLVGWQLAAGTAQAKKPNLVFLFSDDQRFDTLWATATSARPTWIGW